MMEFSQPYTSEDLYEQIDQKIKNFKFVSFDLFDTLAFRTVNRPEDIYRLMGIRYREIYSAEIKNLSVKRIRAEQMARSHGKPEITIDEIYNEISLKDNSIKDNLKRLEKEIEIQSVVPHKRMVEIVRRCKERGQKIIIITDMYLDRATIVAILSKIGVEYDELFISGEMKCTKMTGKIYPVVLSHLNIKADEIVHIGDDKLKDVSRAEENGIYALHSVVLPACSQTADIIVSHLDNMSQRRMENESIDKNNAAFYLGYRTLGPFLVEFCKWIHAIFRQNNSERLIFVAREGYLIKKVYDKLFPEENSKSKYIYLNKNLLRFPILHKKPTIDSLLATVPDKASFTIKELLYYFKITEREKEKFKESYDYDSADERVFLRGNLYTDKQFQSCFELLLKIKADEIEKQYNKLFEYLVNNSLVDKKLLLVNNSFNGNGQKLLCEILDIIDKHSESVLSAQFACSYRCFAKNKNTAFGWLNDLMSDYTAYDFSRYALIFEHLLFEPVGTALEFGADEVIFENRSKECENDKVISEMQDHVLAFVDDYNKNVPISLDQNAVKNVKRLFECPSAEEASLIGNLYDCDADGITALIDLKDVKLSRGIRSAFQIRKYKNVGWRQGAMSLLGVRKSLIKFYSFLSRLKLNGYVKRQRRHR